MYTPVGDERKFSTRNKRKGREGKPTPPPPFVVVVVVIILDFVFVFFSTWP